MYSVFRDIDSQQKSDIFEVGFLRAGFQFFRGPGGKKDFKAPGWPTTKITERVST